MQVFGYVLLVIALVGLFVFTIYNLYAFIKAIVKRVKSKKHKDTEVNVVAVEETEKGKE